MNISKSDLEYQLVRNIYFPLYIYNEVYLRSLFSHRFPFTYRIVLATLSEACMAIAMYSWLLQD